MRSSNDNQVDDDLDGVSYVHLMDAVLRRWRLVAAIVLVAAISTFGAVSQLKDRYTASAFVQIEPRGKKIVPIDSVVPDLKGDTATVESEVEVVRSNKILQRVVEVLQLRSDPEFSRGSSFSSRLKNLFGAATPERRKSPLEADDKRSTSSPGDAYLGREGTPGQGTPRRDAVVATMAKRLKVQRVRNTLVIEIKFEANDPTKAARIANTIAEVYLQRQLQAKQQATAIASKLLAERVDTLRTRLTSAELRLERFKSSNDIFDSEGHFLMDRQLAREMEELVRARDKTAQARARFELARRMQQRGYSADSVSEVLKSHTVRLLRDELTKSQRREAELRTRYGARHPELVKVLADVRKARSGLAAEIAKIVANQNSEFEIAKERQAQLESALAGLKDKIKFNKTKQAELRELTRQVEAAKELYAAMLVRTKQTAATAELQFPDARLIGRADVPLHPVGPKRRQILGLAVAASLVLALALVFALEFLQKGFSRREEIAQVLEHEPIAAFPALGGTSLAARPPPYLLNQIVSDPHSPFAESTRALRHEIDMRAVSRQRQKILIASALPDEGRMLVSANLAYCFAATGRRTLLIDGDLRRGALSNCLGLGDRPGLTDVLAGRMSPIGGVLTDPGSGLNCLPALAAAAPSLSAPELLAGPALHQALDALAQEFEIIIIDAPPLLPVVDGRSYARAADQIAFVTTWRHTPRELAARALATLGADRQKIAGVVINGVAPRDYKSTFSSGGAWPAQSTAA